jgi:hypothetical protein
MSALGHKQTCALQQVMSAFPPISTAKADIKKQARRWKWTTAKAGVFWSVAPPADHASRTHENAREQKTSRLRQGRVGIGAQRLNRRRPSRVRLPGQKLTDVPTYRDVEWQREQLVGGGSERALGDFNVVPQSLDFRRRPQHRVHGIVESGLGPLDAVLSRAVLGSQRLGDLLRGGVVAFGFFQDGLRLVDRRARSSPSVVATRLSCSLARASSRPMRACLRARNVSLLDVSAFSSAAAILAR